MKKENINQLKEISYINEKKIQQYNNIIHAIEKIEYCLDMKLTFNIKQTEKLEEMMSQVLENYYTISHNLIK